MTTYISLKEGLWDSSGGHNTEPTISPRCEFPVSKYNLEQTSRLLPTKLCVKIQHCILTDGVYLACSMLHREIHEQRARCCNRGSACTRFTHGVVAGAGNSRNPSLRMLAWKNGSHMATKWMWDETVSVGVDYQDVEERSGLIWGKRENFFSVT